METILSIDLFWKNIAFTSFPSLLLSLMFSNIVFVVSINVKIFDNTVPNSDDNAWNNKLDFFSIGAFE